MGNRSASGQSLTPTLLHYATARMQEGALKNAILGPRCKCLARLGFATTLACPSSNHDEVRIGNSKMRLPSNKAQVVPVSRFTPVTFGHGAN